MRKTGRLLTLILLACGPIRLTAQSASPSVTPSASAPNASAAVSLSASMSSPIGEGQRQPPDPLALQAQILKLENQLEKATRSPWWADLVLFGILGGVAITVARTWRRVRLDEAKEAAAPAALWKAFLEAAKPDKTDPKNLEEFVKRLEMLAAKTNDVTACTQALFKINDALTQARMTELQQKVQELADKVDQLRPPGKP
jgi:hypothetical protein